MLAFYQVATRITEVYELQLPAEVKQLLDVFDVLNINIQAIGLPLQCLGLGSYYYHLGFIMFAPMLFAAAVLLGFLLLPYAKGILKRDIRWYRRGQPKAMIFAAMPWLLFLSFLVFPMVSSNAFRAFSCEPFSNERSYLRADYAVECDSEEHSQVKQLAWLGILLYPVGISALYALLLLASRRAILNDKPTSLSRALGFLVRDYEPVFYWWELLMTWRQLYMVGFAVLILPGTIEQLLISYLLALVYMLLFAVARPFKEEGDDSFAKACSFALVSVFFFSIVIKVREHASPCPPILAAASSSLCIRWAC